MQSIEVRTNLAQLRTKRAISAANLAVEAGVSRQTIHAIEAGLYVPNTAVSLKLARILGTTVEELFQLEPEQEVNEETAEVFILGEVDSLHKGQPLRVASVNDHLVAVPPDPASWGLQPTDAVFLAPIRNCCDHPLPLHAAVTRDARFEFLDGHLQSKEDGGFISVENGLDLDNCWFHCRRGLVGKYETKMKTRPLAKAWR